MNQTTIKLTISSLLNLLFRVHLPFFGSQQKLFAAIFRSYHAECSKIYNIEWLANQSSISQILRQSDASLPWKMHIYYARREGLELLKHDIEAYLGDVVITAQQRSHLHDELYKLASLSTNLHSEDKAYILDSTTVLPECRLSELLVRMMTVAICNSKST